MGATAARLVALLAVVLGLLAMHGLASGHHGVAGAPGHDAAAVRAVAEPPGAHGTAVMTSHTAETASAVMPPGSGSYAVPTPPSCDDDCPTAVAAVCAAVLAAAAMTAALVRAAAARRSPLSATAGSGHRARAPAPPRRLLPRLDPVAELCVSRT